MPTDSEILSFAAEIRRAALEGTPRNPGGLPSTLANLLVAQAQHETDNFASNIFKQQKNGFGYEFYPGSPWQLPEPGIVADNGSPTAVYSTLANSTKEIVDWIFRRVREGKFPSNLETITTPDQYATLLKGAGFYGDSIANYAAGLKKYFKTVAIGGAGVLILGIALFFLLKSKK